MFSVGQDGVFGMYHKLRHFIVKLPRTISFGNSTQAPDSIGSDSDIYFSCLRIHISLTHNIIRRAQSEHAY